MNVGRTGCCPEIIAEDGAISELPNFFSVDCEKGPPSENNTHQQSLAKSNFLSQVTRDSPSGFSIVDRFLLIIDIRYNGCCWRDFPFYFWYNSCPWFWLESSWLMRDKNLLVRDIPTRSVIRSPMLLYLLPFLLSKMK